VSVANTATYASFVGTRSHLSGYPTNQELSIDFWIFSDRRSLGFGYGVGVFPT
jgi:hypothetical protein